MRLYYKLRDQGRVALYHAEKEEERVMGLAWQRRQLP